MMTTNIAQNTLKLIKIFLLLLLISCQDGDQYAKYRQAELISPGGDQVAIKLAIKDQEHTKGLSGMTAAKFPKGQGLFFWYESSGDRRFWMPDTYFNLDIIFLGSDLKIIAIERNVPAHPGNKEPPPIYRTQSYYAHYVLELRADDPLTKLFKVGDSWKFKASFGLSEIKSKIRPGQ